jgi:peptidylprolyl isomerase
MNRRTAPRLLLTLAVAASLTACGSDDGTASSAGSSSTSSTCDRQPPSSEAPAAVSTDLAVQPEAPCFDAAPPADLVISDVVVGTGADAVDGSTAALKYVGAFYENGEEFDSSWSRGKDETLPVTVGAGQVIAGFDQAVQGMKVGGRRMVVIPSELGYGSDGQGPIPGNATLIFIIDLVQVT